MAEKLISLDYSYKAEYEYLLNSIKASGLIYGDLERGDRREIYVALLNAEQEKILFPIVEEIMLTAFKWRYFKEKIGDSIKTSEDKALLFALLEFDSAGERKYFADKIFPAEAIHLDAVYNFSFGNVKNVWSGYVDLFLEFYSQRPNFEEKAELTAYMTSVNRRNRNPRRGRYYLFEGEEDKILQKVFYYREKDNQIIAKFPETQKIVRKIFG